MNPGENLHITNEDSALCPAAARVQAFSPQHALVAEEFKITTMTDIRLFVLEVSPVCCRKQDRQRKELRVPE